MGAARYFGLCGWWLFIFCRLVYIRQRAFRRTFAAGAGVGPLPRWKVLQYRAPDTGTLRPLLGLFGRAVVGRPNTRSAVGHSRHRHGARNHGGGGVPGFACGLARSRQCLYGFGWPSPAGRPDVFGLRIADCRIGCQTVSPATHRLGGFPENRCRSNIP